MRSYSRSLATENYWESSVFERFFGEFEFSKILFRKLRLNRRSCAPLGSFANAKARAGVIIIAAFTSQLFSGHSGYCESVYVGSYFEKLELGFSKLSTSVFGVDLANKAVANVVNYTLVLRGYSIFADIRGYGWICSEKTSSQVSLKRKFRA